MRREWIEMFGIQDANKRPMSPSMRREWIEINCVSFWEASLPCLPPCGGSGLKCINVMNDMSSDKSPSMRREWIEMV